MLLIKGLGQLLNCVTFSRRNLYAIVIQVKIATVGSAALLTFMVIKQCSENYSKKCLQYLPLNSLQFAASQFLDAIQFVASGSIKTSNIITS